MNLTKSNGPTATNDRPAKTDQTNGLDFPTIERQTKTQATATALLAQRGFVVEPHPSGDYLVSAHGLSHYAQDLEALQDFAIKAGVTHA
jgi:hypothetical protein